MAELAPAIPAPFDLDGLCANLSALRGGRRIERVGVATRSGLWGLWVALPTRDVIYYQAATSQAHQEHLVLHELWHLWRRHRQTTRHDPGRWRQLLPDLDSDLLARVLGEVTATYTPAEEAEADLGATLIRAHAARTTPPRPCQPPASPQTAALCRLTAVLEAPANTTREWLS